MESVNRDGIIILTPFFTPNIGGVETHLNDFVSVLQKYPVPVFVHTYSPLTTSGVKWKNTEHKGNIHIYRYEWFSGNYFHNFEKYPLIQFLYLVPYLFFRTFIWMLFNHKSVGVIHSHGISAAIIGNALACIFHKKHITSIHAIYDHLDSQNIHTVKILSACHKVFTLSKSSRTQLIKWGINPSKLSLYHYWIDLDLFKCNPVESHPFTITFVGRLISKKGINLLLEASASFPDIKFMIIGTGPESTSINDFASCHNNVEFIGQIDNHQIVKYLNKTSVLCVPSLYAEGFGRVIMEALASGVPVIASNRGGIPEALDSSVSILFEPDLLHLKEAINTIINPKTYSSLQKNCRPYAEKHFSESNADIFLKEYSLL